MNPAEILAATLREIAGVSFLGRTREERRAHILEILASALVASVGGYYARVAAGELEAIADGLRQSERVSE
jgi:hypothetical protein